jgi:hypothetical protein
MAQTNEVAVLTTTDDTRLVIRSKPTQAEVKGFVKEHNRRFQAGEPGGPAGNEANQIIAAAFYPTENDIGNEELATPIKLPKTILVGEE